MANLEQLSQNPNQYDDVERGWAWDDPAARHIVDAQENTPIAPVQEGPVQDYTDRTWQEWSGAKKPRYQAHEPLENPRIGSAASTPNAQDQRSEGWAWAGPVSVDAREEIRRKAFDTSSNASEQKTPQPEHHDDEQTSNEINALLEAFSRRFSNPNEHSIQEYRQKKDALFQKFGFMPREAKEILRSWAAYRPDRKDTTAEEEHELRQDAFRANFESIAAVEKMEPGAAAKLYQIYGIRNFMRYEPTELIGQLNSENSGTAEVIITSTDDWNNSFSGKKDSAKVRHEFFMSSPVYAEAARPLEAFTRLSKIKERHGTIQRIVASGHGAEDSLQLSEKHASITTDSLKRTKAIEDLINRGVLEPDAAIILSSCEGMKLAQEISKQTEGIVVASGTASDGIYQLSENKYDYHDNAGSKAKIYEKGRRIDGVRRVRRLGRRALAAFKLAA